MPSAKHVIAGVILLVSIVAAAQSVYSQQYATTTLTTLVTSSQVSTVAVGTEVMTATTGQVRPVYVGPNVTIAGTHGVCGEYFVEAFNGTTGEVLTGSVSANSVVNVYVVTATVFQAWQHQVVAGGTCTPSSSVVSETGMKAYSLSATIPANGGYDLIVHNLSESTVTAQIVANLASAAPRLVTVVQYSTATQTVVQTMAETSVQTLQASSSSSGADMTTLGAVIGLIIVITVVGFLVKTRMSKRAGK